MSKFSLPVLLTCTAFSFAGGFGIAWQMYGSERAPDVAIAAGAAAASDQQATGVNQNPWSKGSAVTPGGQYSAISQPSARDNSTVDEEKLRQLAQSDPTVLRNLIQSYDSEPDQGKRETLKAIISSVDKPEVLAFMTRLATSNDVGRRQEGFALLQNAPDSPQVRSVLKQALANEQTPAVLVQAILALKPAAVDPAEADAIVGQLRGLTQHADPAVRSQSMLQLGQWDKNGVGQDRYAQGLSDPAPQVRQAAIFAIAQSGVRSDSVKAGLIGVINSPNESREVKGSALQALERFSLSKEEFTSFSQARAHLGS
jgi:hypothetical protein